jgi:hypothetical protein
MQGDSFFGIMPAGAPGFEIFAFSADSAIVA